MVMMGVTMCLMCHKQSNLCSSRSLVYIPADSKRTACFWRKIRFVGLFPKMPDLSMSPRHFSSEKFGVYKTSCNFANKCWLDSQFANREFDGYGQFFLTSATDWRTYDILLHKNR